MTIAELMVALGYEVDKESRKKAIEDGKALKGSLQKVLGMVGITVSLGGIIKFGKDSVQAASDVEQMEQKFDTVFANLKDEADGWADAFAHAIGRSKNTIKTYLADQQNLFVGFGMARDEAMKMSEKLTESAIDIASFANLNDDDAINAMTKAVMGESESAKTLGAVLNDTTRATAMAELGFTGAYNSLDQLSKMQVNYTAIMQQSKDAIGDAARSMGSFESNTRAFQAQVKDIKENVGKFILPFANKGLELLSKLTGKLRESTEKLGDVNEEGTTANRIWTKFNEYGEKALSFLGKVVNGGKQVIEMLGGTENALKLLGTVVAAIMAYKAGEKVLGFAKNIGEIGKMLGKVNFKALAVIGVIVLLFLVIQDFVGFLQGKDSLFGKLLENAGIDADATREKFLSFGEDIRQIFRYIKELGGETFAPLHEFWTQYGPQIMQIAQVFFSWLIRQLGYLAGMIGPFVGTVLNLLKAFFALLNGDTEGAVEALKAAWENFKEFIGMIWQSIIDTLDTLFGGLPSKALEWGKDMLQNFIDGIGQKIGALKEKIVGVGTAIKEKLHFSKPDNGPLADADTWTPDMMELFVKGIQDGKAKLKSTVTDVAALIRGAVAGENGAGVLALAGAGQAPAQTAYNAVGGRSIVVNQNNRFENSFHGEDREAQRQAAGQMKKNAHDASTLMAHAIDLGR